MIRAFPSQWPTITGVTTDSSARELKMISNKIAPMKTAVPNLIEYFIFIFALKSQAEDLKRAGPE